MDGILQTWSSLPSSVRWVFGALGSATVGLGGWTFRKCLDLYWKLDHISTNCVPTIQRNTGQTRDAIIAMSAKIDILTEILQKKL